MNEQRLQLAADIREARPYRTRPDDERKTGSMHRSSPREREHRDRGQVAKSPVWREHLRRELD
jgi:hypothetical protein